MQPYTHHLFYHRIWQVIAGEQNFIVTLKESDCRFRFNFADVYWNSRYCFTCLYSRLISNEIDYKWSMHE